MILRLMASLFKKTSVLSSGVIVLALLASFVLTGCGEQGLGGATKGGKTLLTVDGVIITQNEYDKLANQLAKQMGIDKNPEMAKNPMFDMMLKQQTINNLVAMAIMGSEAEKLGVKVTPEDIEQQRKKVIEQVGGEGKFNTILQKNGISIEDFNYQMDRMALIDKIIIKDNLAPTTLSDDDAKAYFNAHKDQFGQPEQIHSKHILVKAMEADIRNEIQEKNNKAKAPELTPAKLDEAVKAELVARKTKAEGLLKKVLENPASFDSLASLQSDDTAAAMNKGDIGMMEQRQTDPGYWAASAIAPIGKVYPQLVQSSYGYHIIQVLEKKAAVLPAFETSKEEIKSRLLQQTKADAFGKWIDKKQASLKSANKITYVDKNYDTSVVPEFGGTPPVGAPPPIQPKKG
ncbi:MAG: SurA N-terminal domain-containing protein [Candidatus Melainabacteria bacterium]|jgi:foldase protein PrsA|nr:SurA N-terminal domain-containing protein [Candidatus Melainabacteria bacterium]